MPNLAANHPQIIHFVVGLLFVGVAFRLISLTPWFKWTKHAGAALLFIGTVATLGAVKSGDDAHGPVERIPGARDLVIHHEEHGKQTRTIFLVVAGAELLALGLAAGVKTGGFAKWAYMASAVVGLYGLSVLYETSQLGGRLVYSYAGGPGLRTGEAIDTERLLLAGLYNQAMADRRAKKPVEAARLIDEMTMRFGADTTVQFLRAESLLLDTKDYAGALAATRAVAIDTMPRWVTRKASLTADAFIAMGMRDSAKAVLAPLVAKFPANTRLKAKFDSLP